jgi:type I restriction enzyme S subunit
MTATRVRLADVAAVNPRDAASVDPNAVVSFLSMADVSTNGTTSPGEDRIFVDVSKGYTQFANNDILVAKITPCFENGKIAQAAVRNDWGAGSTEFHVVRPDSSAIDSRYLLHFLRQTEVRREGERRMTGSAGQRRVPATFLSDLKIPLPDIATQQRIADTLDRTDVLRAQRREAIAHLDELAQSIFIDMFGEPAADPAGWPIRQIGDLADSVTYGTSERANTAGGLPVLRMGNLTMTGEIDLGDLKFLTRATTADKYLVHRGDILFNRTNSPDLVGKTALYRGDEPLAYAGYLVRVRTNELADPEYVAAFLNTRYSKRVLRNMCKTIIGMANINAKQLQAIEIPVPPIDLQRKFAQAIHGIVELKIIQRSHLAELDDLFASLQYRAFRGEL